MKTEDKFTLTKEIFAKRTAISCIPILELEIQTHLNKYPDIEFESISKPITTSYKSLVYIMKFKKKTIPQKENILP